MGLHYDKAASREAKRKLRNIAKRASSPERVWPHVGSYIAMAERKQFATKGAYLGTPWRPLAASTLRYKRTPMLVESGAMKAGLTSRPLNMEIYMGNRAFFGTASQVAIWQHFGTRLHGKQHIPPRTLMKATPTMAQGIGEIIKSYILGETISKRSLL